MMTNTNDQPTRYNYLIFLAMFAMIIMPSSIITTNKMIPIGNEYASAGSLILPLWFVVFFFVMFCYSVIHLPSPTFWNEQSAYNFVFGNLPHLYFGALIAIIAAGFVNIYFISKWKTLVQGRFFWLRSIGSSTIGEAFYTAFAFMLMFIGTLPMIKIGMFIIWAYLFKIIYAVVFSGPANIIVYMPRV